MPTVRGIPGPYRFFFYSFDYSEPRHIRVQRDGKTRKFWLEPVTLAHNNGFPAKELNRIRKLIIEHLDGLLEAWHEHCGDE